MQSKDFAWFVENYNDLFAKYGVCYLAISNQTVLGAYRSAGDAIRGASKIVPPGKFIVQFCNGDESGYTNYIASTQITVI